jgi:hypothetical protein
MSSRLLSMKFMQRAVASSPTASSPTADKHSNKRRKLGAESAASSPVALVDEAAIQAALHEIESKRQQALEKHTTSLTDTHWVIDLPRAAATDADHSSKAPILVEYVGYAAVDKPTAEAEDTLGDQTSVGRMTIGSYNGHNRQSKTKEACVGFFPPDYWSYAS